MKQQLTFINCEDEPRLRRLLDQLVRRLERQLPAGTPSDAVFLHGTIEKNSAHKRYRVALVLNIPGRVLVAKEEGHGAEPVIREAVNELERQLAKHKAFIRSEPLWRRPARRAAIEKEKLKAAAKYSSSREWLGEMILEHLGTLYNFARHEIAAALAVGDLMPGELDVEDVVDAVVEHALSHASDRLANLDVDRWLLRLAKEYLDAEVARLKKERTSMVHLEEDVPETPPEEEVVTQGDEIFDFYQPDEDLKLEDLVPNPFAPTPDQVKESRDLQRYVNRTLAAMPQAWRQAFVLRRVYGLPASDIARILGETENQVTQFLEHAQEFLRQKIVQSRLQVPA